MLGANVTCIVSLSQAASLEDVSVSCMSSVCLYMMHVLGTLYIVPVVLNICMSCVRWMLCDDMFIVSECVLRDFHGPTSR